MAPADQERLARVGRMAEDGDVYLPHDLLDDFWSKVDAAWESAKDSL